MGFLFSDMLRVKGLRKTWNRPCQPPGLRSVEGLVYDLITKNTNRFSSGLTVREMYR